VVRIVVLLTGLCTLSLAASAQPLPDNPSGRFTFNSVDGGVMRLDSQTGDVSYCTRSDERWTCRVVPDERTALEAEIGRLQGDNAALKKALADRGLPLPSGQATGTPVPPAAVPDKPWTRDSDAKEDAEFERMMTRVEKAWRRLLDLMASWRSDRQK
jgi:hypothetical protein